VCLYVGEQWEIAISLMTYVDFGAIAKLKANAKMLRGRNKATSGRKQNNRILV
jgi:hypothetical protein